MTPIDCPICGKESLWNVNPNDKMPLFVGTDCNNDIEYFDDGLINGYWKCPNGHFIYVSRSVTNEED